MCASALGMRSPVDYERFLAGKDAAEAAAPPLSLLRPLRVRSSKSGQATACPGQTRAHQGQPALAMITTTEVSTV